MRRLHSTRLPEFLRSGEAPPEAASPGPGLWQARFDMRTITPILGGGVESFKPDTVDGVRLPGIRGQLRWWWRALYQGVDEGSPEGSAQALFQREAALWGGVGVSSQSKGAETEKEAPGLKSRVRLRLEVVSPGTVKAAGAHQLGGSGPKAFASWTIGRKLGYALFPLQREKEEREGWHQPGPMPTRSVRQRVRFRLHVTVAGEKPGAPPEPEALCQLLGTLCCWLHFGGLGARTRRGFGALELSQAPALGPLPEDLQGRWKSVLQGPGKGGLQGWLRELGALARPVRGALWPVSLVVGSEKEKAREAHEELVDLLHTFRQGKNVGRDPGGRQPGRSRWPEANLLRALVDQEAPGVGFDHDPPPGSLDNGAPRAAFGLPIQVKFKDKRDQRANAELLPGLGNGRPGEADGEPAASAQGKRWASPLLLRPIRGPGGGYHPVAVLLNTRVPPQVTIEFAGPGLPSQTAEVKRSHGAREPILKELAKAKGDALETFASWVSAKPGYERHEVPTPGPAPEKERHA